VTFLLFLLRGGGVLFFVLIFCSCREGDNKETWGVLVPSIPSSIVLEREGETAVSYILRQTHEPLFRKTDGQNFTSKLLLDWERNLDYSRYRFCPDTSFRFNVKRGFSLEYFVSYISNVTGKHAGGFELQRDSQCVTVKFPSPRMGYLDFLSRYNNAPSIVEEDGVVAGLGSFMVSSISGSQAVLTRKQRVRRGYNKIVFYAYSGPGDPRLEDRSISDFNKIPPHQQPGWIKKEFHEFSNIELAAVALGINHPDKRVRSVLYNCIDPVAFRAAFVPNKKDYIDIKTVLPVGVAGGRGGRPEQACEGLVALNPGPIVLANPKKDNHDQLAKFVLNFNKKTGLHLRVKAFAPAEMNPMLYETSRQRPYQLIVLALGAYKSDSFEFVKLYAGTPLALDFVPNVMRKKYSKILATDDTNMKETLTRELAEEIRKEALALPLYQTVAVKYYPRKVRNLLVGDGFVEYPEVADFRW
jgi:hypothetical protein